MWEVLWSIEASAIDSHSLLLPTSTKTANQIQEYLWLQMGLHTFDIIMISSTQRELQQCQNGYASEPNMIVSRIWYGDMGCVLLDLPKLRMCSALYNNALKNFHELLKFVCKSLFPQVHEVEAILFCKWMSLERMHAGNEVMLSLNMSLKTLWRGYISAQGFWVEI